MDPGHRVRSKCQSRLAHQHSQGSRMSIEGPQAAGVGTSSRRPRTPCGLTSTSNLAQRPRSQYSSTKIFKAESPPRGLARHFDHATISAPSSTSKGER